MTVADNIGFGLKVRKTPKDRIRTKVGELLEHHQPARQGRPLPVPALGRPAAARRAGPGARDRAPGPPARRAAVGARREDPGRAAQGDPLDPAPARDHDGLRDPRPGGGAVAVRPGRRHERGPDRADRHRRPTSTTSRRRRSWPRSSGRSTSSAGRSSSRAPAGCRSPARRSALRSHRGGPRGHGNHAWRSARRASSSARAAARTDCRARSRTSASSARSCGPGSGSARAIAPLSFDTFNDPHMRPAQIDEVVTVSFPPEACLVIGAGPAPEIDIVAGE